MIIAFIFFNENEIFNIFIFFANINLKSVKTPALKPEHLT